MNTLLEAIGIVLETYFGFEFPNACPIGDSLSRAIYVYTKALFSSKIFGKMSTVAISFVFDKYCSIMD